VSVINLDNAKRITSSKLLFADKIIYIKGAANYMSLIGAKLAKFLDIDTVSFQRGIYQGKQVIFSEQYYNKDTEKRITGGKLLREYHEYIEPNHPDAVSPIDEEYFNNLTDIWGALEFKYGLKYEKDIPEVMMNFVKAFCFDILTGNSDRNQSNWEIIVSEEKISMAPSYDFDDVFDFISYYLSPEHTEEEEMNYLLENFLNTSAPEFANIFYEMYDKLTVKELIKIINDVEVEHELELNQKFKDQIIKEYTNHRLEIEKIINKRRGKVM